MNGRKPALPDDDVFRPTPDNRDVDLGILKRDFPLTESQVPIMKAPDDWPPPPSDISSKDS